MDVRVQNVNSRIRVADAQALLTPEVLRAIVEAVKQALVEDRALQAQRDDDQSIRRSAARLS